MAESLVSMAFWLFSYVESMSFDCAMTWLWNIYGTRMSLPYWKEKSKRRPSMMMSMICAVFASMEYRFFSAEL